MPARIAGRPSKPANSSLTERRPGGAALSARPGTAAIGGLHKPAVAPRAAEVSVAGGPPGFQLDGGLKFQGEHPAQAAGCVGLEPGLGVPAMRASTSASQAWGSMLLSLAVPIRVYIAAARLPPRSEPANNQERLPRA